MAVLKTNTVDVNVVNPLCTDGKKPKVNVCHRPVGNPSNDQTLCLASNAVATHLNGHDDCLGACDAICVNYSAKTSHPPISLSRIVEQSDFRLTAQPNPFTNSTRINFSSTRDEEIQLLVYNISGQIVTELFKGIVSANQTKSVEFNANDLSQGLYFVRMIDENGNGITSSVILNK